MGLGVAIVELVAVIKYDYRRLAGMRCSAEVLRSRENHGSQTFD